MDDKKVAVLLSTYNGEKYLREQLDSIENQTYKNIQIVIRDDGSHDNTVEIINEYSKKYGNWCKGSCVNWVREPFVF